MAHELTVYCKLIRAAVLGKIQYKSDFLVGLISIVVLNSVNIAMLGVLVHNFGTLAGWSMWHLLFLYGLWNMGRAIYSLFFWHIYRFEELIVDGTFDIYMVRPLRLITQFLGRDIGYPGIGDMLVGLGAVILARSNLELNWGIGLWLFFIACVISGGLIMFAINWVIATTSFWLTRVQSAMNIADRFCVLVQQYPVAIFGRWFQVFTTMFLPVAFINYFPAVVLLEMETELQIWYYFSPLVAVGLIALAAWFWGMGVKRYSSAGS